ncbi:MAG: bifunctional chorismate mutase/prephenate dehydratase [Deltaproteobacteria bacterium]|jgi:chorismate mutase/prephenate dehydratase|nr:bifunctional chorismate mutase/prephenate dehydratase [Deltaproteobacteria bacterium]
MSDQPDNPAGQAAGPPADFRALLAPLRAEIDQLDARLLDLLQQRARAAIELGRIKKRSSLPIMDLTREREVVTRLAQKSGPGEGLGTEAVIGVFTEIIKACRAAQAPTKVAFLGPAGTFSHAAALQQFGRLAQLIPCDDLAEAFRAAEAGEADFALAPFENTTEGIVGQTLDLMTATDLRVQATLNLPVRLSLMSVHGELPRIRSVSSHPQALAQCRNWLALNMPGVELRPAVSTAAGATMALSDESTAVIGHPSLSSFYNLTVMSGDLQDFKHNQTCFFILSRDDGLPTGRDRTLAWFAAPHSSGSLYNCLQPLATAGVNLTRLHSRPNPGQPWEYLFFLELEGHFQDEKVIAAIAALKAETEKCRVLGSYTAPEEPAETSAKVQSAPLF